MTNTKIEAEEWLIENKYLTENVMNRKKLTKCCNAPAIMTFHEKGRLRSNVEFMVCSKCGKGDLWRLEGIEIKDLIIKEK